MKKSPLEAALEAWGTAHKLKGKAVLKALLKKFGVPTRIAKELRLRPGTVPAIRKLLRDAGLYRPFKLEDRLTELGYKTAREFFTANSMKTFGKMADMLGCTWMAVQKQYERTFKVELERTANG